MQIIMNSWVANKAWLSHMQGVCPQCGARLSSTKQRSMIERKLQTIYLDLSLTLSYKSHSPYNFNRDK